MKKLIKRYMADSNPWVDPFAGMHSPAHIRNDLNPDANAEYHMDALESLKTSHTDVAAGVLFDPPYSTNQIKESYQGFGLASNPCSTQYRSAMKVEINRIVKPGGIIISFGWNSNGCSTYKEKHKKLARLEKLEVLLIAHGMTKNDTIVTVERKIQETLE